jgi:hypothetical protein
LHISVEVNKNPDLVLSSVVNVLLAQHLGHENPPNLLRQELAGLELHDFVLEFFSESASLQELKEDLDWLVFASLYKAEFLLLASLLFSVNRLVSLIDRSPEGSQCKPNLVSQPEV